MSRPRERSLLPLPPLRPPGDVWIGAELSGQMAPDTGPLPAIDQAALDTAVRRFPYWLAQWRRHGIGIADLNRLVPEIVAEYHRARAKP